MEGCSPLCIPPPGAVGFAGLCSKAKDSVWFICVEPLWQGRGEHILHPYPRQESLFARIQPKNESLIVQNHRRCWGHQPLQNQNFMARVQLKWKQQKWSFIFYSSDPSSWLLHRYSTSHSSCFFEIPWLPLLSMDIWAVCKSSYQFCLLEFVCFCQHWALLSMDHKAIPGRLCV